MPFEDFIQVGRRSRSCWLDKLSLDNPLVKSIDQSLTLSQTSPGFYMSVEQVLENTVGKGEIARNGQFLLFPQCFSPFRELSAIFIKL